MIEGILACGSVVFINLSFLFGFKFMRKNRKVSIIAMFLIILIGDIIIHILIAITSSYSEMMMWIMISFPVVAFASFLICLLGSIFIEFWDKKHPYFKNGMERNS